MLSIEHGRRLSPDKDYMTKNEKIVMDKMLKDGQLTFFRLKECQRKKCKKLIVKSKKFCSLKCKKKVKKKIKKSGGSK